MLNKLIR